VCSVQAGYAWAYVHSHSLRSGVIVPTLFRLATWTLPVFMVLFLSRTDPFDYLKLRKVARRGFTWGVVIGMIIVGLNWIGAGLWNHRWNINFDLGLNLWIGPVLLVGLSEEVLFRGFFLQKFAELTSFARANLLQAFLFILIHVPGWALMGQFNSPAIVHPICYVFGIGLVLGYVLKKSNSLWACMVIHSFSNFASFGIAAA
jgi:membrane protease YdiL (CAAX protease family)